MWTIAQLKRLPYGNSPNQGRRSLASPRTESELERSIRNPLTRRPYKQLDRNPYDPERSVREHRAAGHTPVRSKSIAAETDFTADSVSSRHCTLRSDFRPMYCLPGKPNVGKTLALELTYFLDVVTVEAIEL